MIVRSTTAGGNEALPFTLTGFGVAGALVVGRQLVFWVCVGALDPAFAGNGVVTNTGFAVVRIVSTCLSVMVELARVISGVALMEMAYA